MSKTSRSGEIERLQISKLGEKGVINGSRTTELYKLNDNDKVLEMSHIAVIT
jgi:hypothetical protein